MAINRCGTLASDPDFTPFHGLRYQTEPIVRVAVTPNEPSDLAKLANGLKLLTHADPAAIAKVRCDPTKLYYRLPIGNYLLVGTLRHVADH
jgi:hypothetical protein